MSKKKLCLVCRLYQTEEYYVNIRNKQLEEMKNQYIFKNMRYCCNDCFEKLGGIRDWEKVLIGIKQQEEDFLNIQKKWKEFQKEKDNLNSVKEKELDDSIIWG